MGYSGSTSLGSQTNPVAPGRIENSGGEDAIRPVLFISFHTKDGRSLDSGGADISRMAAGATSRFSGSMWDINRESIRRISWETQWFSLEGGVSSSGFISSY